jgi:peptidyl-prolyl cis-trans isomerase D
MAIIGKIREKSWVIVAFVGLALLTFIFADYFKGGPSNEGTGLGTINGKTIDPTEFEKYEYFQVMNDSKQMQQQGKEYTEEDKKQSTERAWLQTTQTLVLADEFEALGIECKESEMYDQLAGKNGFPINPEIAKSFVDSTTGKYNPDLLLKVLNEKDNDTSQQRLQEWQIEKIQRIDYRRTEKYMQLMTLGAYTTTLEAKEEYNAKMANKEISFVVSDYSRITDKEIKITEAEILACYDLHKGEKKYESKAGRNVNYFDINIVPSKADSIAFNGNQAKIKMEFANSIDDSAFVMKNSQVKNYNSKNNYYRVEGTEGVDPKMTYPKYLDTVFKRASVGQVVGPYNVGENVCISKFLGFNTKEAKVRHILIKAERKDLTAVAKAAKQADSIISILNKANFDALCTKFSGDPGSKDKGGVIDWFMDNGQMVPEFAKYAMNEPVGKFGKTQTDFGFHIMEVLERRQTAPSLALVQLKFVPSAATLSAIGSKANSLLYKISNKLDKISDPYKKVAEFDSIAKREKYFSRPVRILTEKPEVQGFANTYSEDKILNLAYDSEAKVGTLISAPFKDEKRYILAIVSSIREEGIPIYQDVYDQMKAEAIKGKKAKRMINELKNIKSLDQLAAKVKGQVKTGSVKFSSPSIDGGGYEPEIVGALYSALAKPGKLFPAFTGNAGVYFIMITKSTKATPTATYKVEQKEMYTQLKGNMQGSLSSALMKLKNVKDTRRIRTM